MKMRLKNPRHVFEYTLVDLEQLRSWWESNGNFGMRDLHRCLPECATTPGRNHDSACQYVRSVDPQAATDAASAYLKSLAPTPRYEISMFLNAEAVGIPDPDRSPQAELTLSFLTDPITVHPDGRFGNGRHRVTALLDAGVTGSIPVIVTA